MTLRKLSLNECTIISCVKGHEGNRRVYYILGAWAWRRCVLKLDKEEVEAQGGRKSCPDPGEGGPLWAVAGNTLCSERPSEPTAALCPPCIYTLTSRLVVKYICFLHRKPCAVFSPYYKFHAVKIWFSFGSSCFNTNHKLKHVVLTVLCITL